MLDLWQRFAKETLPMAGEPRCVAARQHSQAASSDRRQRGMTLPPGAETFGHLRCRVQHSDATRRKLLKGAFEQWIVGAAENQRVDAAEHFQITLHREARDL